MKIWIRGVSASGKSTLAKRLSKELDIPHIELDEMFWLPNWQNRNAEEFLTLVDKKLTEENWVLDGNYQLVFKQLNPKPDYVVWLNYPFCKVIWRCVSRTHKRISKGIPVCNGNKETLKHQFSFKGSMLIWVLRTFNRRRRQLRALQTTQDNIIEIMNDKDIEKFIRHIKP